MFTYPLAPSQISLISMFTIGIPAFFLALEPNKNIIKGHFLTERIPESPSCSRDRRARSRRAALYLGAHLE